MSQDISLIFLKAPKVILALYRAEKAGSWIWPATLQKMPEEVV